MNIITLTKFRELYNELFILFYKPQSRSYDFSITLKQE